MSREASIEVQTRQAQLKERLRRVSELMRQRDELTATMSEQPNYLNALRELSAINCNIHTNKRIIQNLKTGGPSHGEEVPKDIINQNTAGGANTNRP